MGREREKSHARIDSQYERRPSAAIIPGGYFAVAIEGAAPFPRRDYWGGLFLRGGKVTVRIFFVAYLH